jgi:hypothetical protein
MQKNSIQITLDARPAASLPHPFLNARINRKVSAGHPATAKEENAENKVNARKTPFAEKQHGLGGLPLTAA